MPATVLCVRDPDAANDYVIDGEVQIVEVDLGRVFDGPKSFDLHLSPSEQQAWCHSQLAQVADLDPQSPVRRRVVELCAALLEEAGTAPMAMPAPLADARARGPVILVVRDPDCENEVVLDGPICAIDIDLGARFDGLADMTHALGFDGAQREVARWRAAVSDLQADSPVRAAVEELAALAQDYLDDEQH